MANAAEITASIMRQKARRKREMTLLALAAIMVIACVAAWLHVDGIATTGEAMCGYEEHTHNANCYELVYTCGYEEGEVLSEAPDYAAIEAEIRAEFEADVAAQAEEQASALQAAQDAAAAEAEAAGEDPDLAREAIAAAAEPTPTVDEDALRAAVDAAYAEAEAAMEVHTHTEACTEARLVCDLEEHTHVPLCYSNPNIDAETADDWEATFADVELTGEWPQDVLAIAETQIGYTESEQNFQLGDGGERRGYTRYGDWYGNPYGVWDGLFVMFCLEYAGVDTEYLPCESGAYAWTAALQHASAYEPAHAYTPQPGDIVFFNDDFEDNDKADRVGIVKSLNEDLDELIVIEGDVNNTVAEAPYALSSETIQGYCNVAARQDAANAPANSVTPIDEYGEEEDNQAEGDETNEDAGEDVDDGENNLTNTDGIDEADKDKTDEANADDADEADNADTNGTETDETKDTSTPPADTKTDGEDKVTAEESEGGVAPAPSDESEPSKIVPIYATIVNGDQEIINVAEIATFATGASQATANADSNLSHNEDAHDEAVASAGEASSNALASITNASDPKDTNEQDEQEASNDLAIQGKAEASDPTEGENEESTDALNKASSGSQDDSDLQGNDKGSNADEAHKADAGHKVDGASQGKDQGEDVEPLDLGVYLTTATLEHHSAQTEDWELLDSEVVLNWDDKVRFTFDYTLPADTLSRETNTVATKVSGVTEFEAQKGDILDELSKKPLGTYEVLKNGTVVLSFNDVSVQQNEDNAIEGTISFECEAAAIDVDAEGKATISCGVGDPVTVMIVKNLQPEDPEGSQGPDDADKKDEANDPNDDEDAADEQVDSSSFTTFACTAVDGDTKEPLDGAVFAIYEYSKGTESYGEAPIATVASGENGTAGVVEIADVHYNTAYKMVETAAPEGYDLLAEPVYFDVKCETKTEEASNENQSTNGDVLDTVSEPVAMDPATAEEKTQTLAEGCYPEDYVFSSDVLELQDDGGYVLANYTPRTAITVEELWQTEQQTESVPIELWRMARSENSPAVEHEKVATETLQANSVDPWTTTFEELPLTGLSGEEQPVAYEYYVVEQPSHLYTLIGMTTDENIPMVHVAEDGTVETNADGGYKNVTGVTGGTITVTNAYNETGYELPASGGSGVLPYYLGGGLLATAALAFALMKRNHFGRREERRTL